MNGQQIVSEAWINEVRIPFQHTADSLFQQQRCERPNPGGGGGGRT